MIYKGHKVYIQNRYPAIFLNGKNHYIHRLEWEKSNGKIPKGGIIRHKDGNVFNWNIDNLELITKSESIINYHGVKLIARKDETEKQYNSIVEAAKGCEVSKNSIHLVLNGTRKEVKGWSFERV